MKLLPKLFLLLLLATTACRKEGAEERSTPPPYVPIQLDTSWLVLGNRALDIRDTFFLRFNKPVAIGYVRLLSNTCLPDLAWTTADSGHIVKFYNLLCGRLGEDYQFEYQVKDTTHTIVVDTVRFSYYTRRLPLEGELVQYRLSADNQYCWATTINPNRLHRIGLYDTADKKVWNLDFQPGRMAFNPHNGKLYILNYPFNNALYSDRIYVFDPVGGRVEKVITVAPDHYDEPGKHIEVYSLGFGANGYGVLITGTREYGLGRWRIIDSRQEDTVYAHPDWIASTTGYGNYNFKDFVSAQPNYNGTKLYLRENYAKPRMGVLDCTTGVLEELTYCDTNPNHYIVPNRVKDQLFIGSFIYQGLITNGVCSANFSEFDNRFSETADFSYRKGEDNILYYRSRDYDYELLILDYSRGQVLMKTNVHPYFTAITTTTDGLYLLASQGNALFVYRTAMFYRYIK